MSHTDSTDTSTTTGAVTPAPVAFPVVHIQDDLALATACARWQQLPAIALDTEFERVKTFWPKLALIQLCDGEQIALIDPLSIQNWAPFAALLKAPGVVKVMHAAGEDLEAFIGGCDAAPSPLFDTQTALALLGKGASLGYGAMVQQFFGVVLSKDMARTDWLMRPLSDEQLAYAAADVQYLLPIWQQTTAELNARQLFDWHRQDGEYAVNRVGEAEPPEQLYRKLKAAYVLRGVQLAVARELCIWREQEARQNNLPRGHLMKDEGLLLLAQKAPRNWPALSALEVLHPRTLRLHGSAMLAVIERALALPASDWPAPVRRLIDVPNGRAAHDALVAAVAAFAETRSIPAETLFSRRALENLLLAVADAAPTAPAFWQGWRRNALQSDFATALTAAGFTLPIWW